MNKQNILIIIIVAIIMFGAGLYISQLSVKLPEVKTPPENTLTTTTPTKDVTLPTEIEKTTDEPTKIIPTNEIQWKTFVNKEYGFEFQYPANWIVSEKLAGNQIDITGRDYAIFATVTNPDRPGKEGTDIPMERIILSNGTTGCEGMNFGRTGMRAVTGSWEEGFGLIYYRQLCFVTDGNVAKYWTLNISMSAFNKDSQALLDKSMSTLKFYKHSFVYN